MSTLDTDLTVTASALVPAHQPRMVSRRSMLGGLGLGSLAALVAPMFGLAPTAAADPTRPQDTPTPPPANYTPAGPFTVGASCELTEEYFLTDEILIDVAGGDEIMPFTTKPGDIEAIVVTGSGTSRQVAHLARDTSTVSGWSYTTITTGLEEVSGAAVGGNTQPYLLVSGVGSYDGTLASEVIVMSLGDSGWKQVGNPIDVANIGTIKSGIGPAGQFFYAWSLERVPTGVAWKMQLTVSVIDPTQQTAATVLKTQYDDVAVDDLWMRYDPQGKDGWIVFQYQGEFMRGVQTGATSFQTPPLAGITENWLNTPDLEALVGIYGSGPDVVWQDTNGTIRISNPTSTTGIGDTTGGNPSSVATWVSDVGYQFAFCLNDTINMIGQYRSTHAVEAFMPPIPMLPGITKVFGVDTDLSHSVLFAVDLDASLSVLSLGPTGWTQNVVHQASATLQEVTSWACHIPVTDANNLPVTLAAVQISTDRPVAVWQEGETKGASTTLVPGTPVTFTADGTGTLVLALPTNELDAAQLTAQALDSTGKPSGSPLTIGPDTDVQKFLAGTGALTSVRSKVTGLGSKLTGDALTGAQNTTWDTASQTYQSQGDLFPVITSLSGTTQTTAAAACATAVAHVANLPTAVPAAASDIRSGYLDLTGSAPTFATSNDPNHFDSMITGDTGWWQKVDTDLESFYHGLRHGAIHMSKMVSSWADDAKTWTVNMLIDLGNDLEHVVNFVVKTAKEAVHAICAFFKALGADLEKAWNWLKHFVLGVIKDADVTAKQLQAWFADLTTAGVNILTTVKNQVNKDFTSFESEITSAITNAQSAVDGLLFGTECPTPTSTKDSSGDNSSLEFKVVDDFFKVMQDGPANWLWHKIKKHLPSLGGSDLNVDETMFQDAVTDLETGLKDAGDSVTALYGTVYDAFKTFTTPGAFNQAGIGTLFTDVDGLVVDVLTTANHIVDAVLELVEDLLKALQDLLNSEFLPSVLVEIFKLAGIDATVSIGRVMTLIVAYPITIVHNLWVGEGPLFDFSNDTTTHHTGVGRGAADKNGFGLNLAAGVVQYIWSVVDVYIDLESIMDRDIQEANASTTSLMNLADWILPSIMTILQWPTPWNATSTPAPCKNWDFTDTTQWGKYNVFVPGIILTTIVPWVCQGIADIWQRKSPDSDNAELLSDFATPIVQCAMAAGNNILGAWWQYANQHASKTDKANAVLDWTIPNLSYLDCPLAMELVVDLSESMSLIAKGIIDWIANFGATAICFQQAVAAHG